MRPKPPQKPPQRPSSTWTRVPSRQPSCTLRPRSWLWTRDAVQAGRCAQTFQTQRTTPPAPPRARAHLGSAGALALRIPRTRQCRVRRLSPLVAFALPSQVSLHTHNLGKDLIGVIKQLVGHGDPATSRGHTHLARPILGSMVRFQQRAGLDCRRDLVSSWGTWLRPCTGTVLSKPTSLLLQEGTAPDGMRTTLASSLLGRTVKPPRSRCGHMSNTASTPRVCQGRAAPTWTVGTHRAGVRPSELQCRPRKLATFLTHVTQSLPSPAIRVVSSPSPGDASPDQETRRQLAHDGLRVTRQLGQEKNRWCFHLPVRFPRTR